MKVIGTKSKLFIKMCNCNFLLHILSEFIDFIDTQLFIFIIQFFIFGSVSGVGMKAILRMVLVATTLEER